MAAAAVVAAGAGAGASSAQAAPFTVTNLDDTGPGSLRDAIAQANANPDADTISFQSGLSGTIAVGSEMSIAESVEIVGPGPDAITLDGGGSTGIIRSQGVDVVSISGLTFTNGKPDIGYQGGALALYADSARLDDVVVTDSIAGRGGGAFLATNDASVTGSRFTGNTAEFTGGGISVGGVAGGDPGDAIEIVDTVVTGNEATTSGGLGGGISVYAADSDVLIEAVTVADNDALGSGGGIWAYGRYGNAHETVVRSSTITSNSAAGGGGGLSFNSANGPTTVINSTVEGNEAGSGGGIHFADIANGAFELIDSTVTGNTAVNGGGVMRGATPSPPRRSYAALDVSSSVIDGNAASNGGTDFANGPNTYDDLTIGNSLVGSVAGVTYVADPPASNIVGEDSKLRSLADNGGPTETMLPKPTSPLVDAGLANGLTKDQRGGPRTVEHPDAPNVNGSDGTDIGAAELDVLEDPYLWIRKPQLQSGKEIEVAIKAGASEDVTASATGVITIRKGNAVARTTFDTVTTGRRATLTVKPKTGPGNRRIRRALTKGRVVTAEIRGKLKDDSGNVYKRVLKAKLKLRG